MSYKGVTVTTVKGVAYYYHRLSKTPLGKVYGSPEFDAAYKAAVSSLKAEAQADAPAWASLWSKYQRSPEWSALAPGAQQNETAVYNVLRERWAWMKLEDLSDASFMGEVYELRDELSAAGTPRKADAYVAFIRKMLTFAKRRALIERNHMAEDGGVPRLYKPGQRADMLHTPEVRRSVMALAPLGLYDLYLVALYTGARKSDMLAWTHANYDGSWLVWTPSKTAGKTGVKVELPVYLTPPLKEALDRLSSRALGDGSLCGISASALDKQWYRVRDAIPAAAGLHWHDLRGTLLSMLADAGCTDPERAAISGHSMGQGGAKMLSSYTARSRSLAVNAYTKLNTWEKSK